MTDSIKKKDAVGGVSPLTVAAAGVAGVVVGVGATFVASMVKNPETQEKAKEVIGDVKEKVEESKDGLKKALNEVTDVLRSETEKVKEDIKTTWQK